MLFTKENLEYPFELIVKCKEYDSPLVYHPEKNLQEHSLQAMNHTFRESNDTDLILAALLHDVGKIKNPLGHDKEAVIMLNDYASTKTLWLIEHHMRIWYYLLGDMRKLSSCKYLSEHPWLPELIQLARFDKMGRNPNKTTKFEPERIIDRLNEKADKHFK